MKNKMYKGPKAVPIEQKDGSINVEIDMKCTHCGKPLTKATKYGMFCEDGCGEKEAKEAMIEMMQLSALICPEHGKDDEFSHKNLELFLEGGD